MFRRCALHAVCTVRRRHLCRPTERQAPAAPEIETKQARSIPHDRAYAPPVGTANNAAELSWHSRAAAQEHIDIPHQSLAGFKLNLSTSAICHPNRQSTTPKRTQVRFKEPVCITGIKVGAPPGAAGLPALEGDARPSVRSGFTEWITASFVSGPSSEVVWFLAFLLLRRGPASQNPDSHAGCSRESWRRCPPHASPACASRACCPPPARRPCASRWAEEVAAPQLCVGRGTCGRLAFTC